MQLFINLGRTIVNKWLLLHVQLLDLLIQRTKQLFAHNLLVTLLFTSLRMDATGFDLIAYHATHKGVSFVAV